MEEEILLDSPQEVVLSDEQLQDIIDAITSRPASYPLSDSQYSGLLSAISAGGSVSETGADTVAAIESLKIVNQFQLLTISILIGILVIMFFKRK